MAFEPSSLNFPPPGGGGVAAGPGTAITDNLVVRGDTTGIQGSAISIGDEASSTVIINAAGAGADTSIEIRAKGSGYLAIQSGNNPVYFVTNGTTKWSISAGGILGINDNASRITLQGGLILKGKTETALPAATTDFAAGECGIHKDTNLGTRSFCWNDGGTIYSVPLT